MAWSNVGFDGTINEAEWSKLSSLLGNGYVAAGNGDCLVTAVPGARSVSVAAGALYGDGVLSTNSAAETVALTTPVNGQWYAVCLRRTWATNTSALVAIAGATTTTTTPTAPPTAFPTLNTNTGVLTDQPIAWAWCNSANTTVVVYDIRLKAVKSLPPVVANATERAAKFMTPTQGLQVWRDDLGAVETYYGLYNASTNPGGRDIAGWYVSDRSGGLIPIKPTSAIIGTGTGSANALGVVTVSNATSIILTNVFSSEYSKYRVLFNFYNGVNGANNYLRFGTNGTPNTTTEYRWTYSGVAGTATRRLGGGFSDSVINCLYPQTAVGGRLPISYEISNPYEADTTHVFISGANGDGGIGAGYGAGAFTGGTSFTDLVLLPSSGSYYGTVQVFGYND